MATALTITTLPGPYATDGVAITWVAADTTNGNEFTSTGREILLVRNTDGANPHTVTVTSQPDPYNRTGDIASDSIAANGFVAYQQFPRAGWATTSGVIEVDGDDAQLEFAVLRLP
jgi:hypothetical protein